MQAEETTDLHLCCSLSSESSSPDTAENTVKQRNNGTSGPNIAITRAQMNLRGRRRRKERPETAGWAHHRWWTCTCRAGRAAAVDSAGPVPLQRSVHAQEAGRRCCALAPAHVALLVRLWGQDEPSSGRSHGRSTRIVSLAADVPPCSSSSSSRYADPLREDLAVREPLNIHNRKKNKTVRKLKHNCSPQNKAQLPPPRSPMLPDTAKHVYLRGRSHRWAN
jgi:hypothetical protein